MARLRMHLPMLFARVMSNTVVTDCRLEAIIDGLRLMADEPSKLNADSSSTMSSDGDEVALLSSAQIFLSELGTASLFQ